MAKSKKKSNKLLSWFNTGPKKLLAFVVVFVIIGGGVMAYSSFASNVARCKPNVYFSDDTKNKEAGLQGTVNCANTTNNRTCVDILFEKSKDNKNPWKQIHKLASCNNGNELISASKSITYNGAYNCFRVTVSGSYSDENYKTIKFDKAPVSKCY